MNLANLAKLATEATKGPWQASGSTAWKRLRDRPRAEAMTTEAGKRLLERQMGPVSKQLWYSSRGWARAISAIEAEAVAVRNAEIAAAVRELFIPGAQTAAAMDEARQGLGWSDGWDAAVERALAIIEPKP